MGVLENMSLDSDSSKLSIALVESGISSISGMRSSGLDDYLSRLRIPVCSVLSNRERTYRKSLNRYAWKTHSKENVL
jgi:Zn-dependent M16 (insulinase) family peptidase